MINKKDERVQKLYDRGMRSPRAIAAKLGYTENLETDGIDRVLEAFGRLGLPMPVHQHSSFGYGNGCDCE